MSVVFTPQERIDRINRIRRFPAELEAAVQGLNEEQLTTRYDPTEWSVAQNVHHCVDSHVNAYIRTRLILTEDKPPIKPYLQESWAELPDAKTWLPVINKIDNTSEQARALDQWLQRYPPDEPFISTAGAQPQAA